MSTKLLTIAKDEWRYWYRSKLSVSLIVLATILVISSVVITSISLSQATHDREHLQEKAQSEFTSQPGRHPHRMVHYGHYVFRAPSPLSSIDPGIDSYTGTSIFLEGHQQNTAMFAEQRTSSGLTRFSKLTPAFMMQIIAPLLLILIGYSVVSRERESGTLPFIVAQGVSLQTFMFGKFFALLAAALLLLTPIVVGSLLATANGEAFSLVISFVVAHSVYFVIWCALIVIVSTRSTKNSSSFSMLIVMWIALSIIVPRIASSTASSMIESPSKLETDFEVIREVRRLGGGHNISAPEVAKLKAELFEKYQVDSLEKLPVNFKGIVGQIAEAKLTEVLNQFAEKRMDEELAQAQIARQFGWVTPVLALRTASMMLAGSNLETHHRFLREAEVLRFDFVQRLNKLQEEKLTYVDDARISQDPEREERVKLNTEDWQLLDAFTFTPDTAAVRLQKSLPSLLQLMLWIVLLLLVARNTKGILK